MAGARARVRQLATPCVCIITSLEFTTSLLAQKAGEEDAEGLASVPHRH